MQKQSFEDTLAQVREIIDRIESGEMPLEESVSRYEAGMKALGALEKELEEMKRRVTVLQEHPDGTVSETPMEGME